MMKLLTQACASVDPVLATWGIRSKKELKESPHQSCSMSSTHQAHEDLVFVRRFSPDFWNR